MAVQIHAGSAAFREVARLLNDKRLVKRLSIKAVNAAGSELRRSLASELPRVIAAPRTAFQIKARAAFRSQSEPAYRVSFQKQIELSRIKAAAKRFEKRAGRSGFATGRFTIRAAGGKALHFRAVSREGSGQKAKLQLLPAGPLPGRGLAGVSLSSDLRRYPGLAGLEDRAIETAADAMADAIEAALARARQRAT